MKGLFHWRLLGAHLLRRRAGCLQPENSGPFVLATAPIISPCGPGSSLQCSGNRSHPVNHSLVISVPPRRSTASARPPRNGLAVLRKEKWVWRLETCDGAFDFVPTHSAAGPRLDQLQTLEATLRPTLVLPLQPLIVLPATSVVALCCH